MLNIKPSGLAARLLHLFPTEFRRRHGPQMVETYADLERAGKAPRLPFVALDLLVSALRVHLEALREPSYELPVSQSDSTLGGPHMEGFARDLRLALRGLLRAPGFTVIAVVTLALGIGANAAIFSVVQGVLLSSLDLADPDRLVAVWHQDLQDPDERSTVSPGNFRDWREQSGAFEALAAYGYETLTLGSGNRVDVESRRVESLAVTGDFFRVTGVEAIQGSLLTAEDDAATATTGSRAVLGYETWRTIFGGDTALIGQSVQLDGKPVEVAGILPPGFRIASQPVDVYVPMGWDEEFRGNRTEYSYRVVGRLAPGVSLGEAQQRLDAVMASLRRDFPTENGDLAAAVLPLRSDLVRHVATPIWLVMGAVGMVLLIGCANLAQLLLARAEARRCELAVQRALGATAWTLVRRSITESLLLALLGCVAGLAVARATLSTLVSTLPVEVPGLDAIAIDPTVLAFTVGVSLLAALLFGAAPALRLPSADRLRQGRGVAGQSTRGSGPTVISGSLLTVAEVALAVVLLCGTGLLLRSLQASTSVEPGYATDVLRVRASLGGAGYEDGQQRVAYLERARERLAALPGVEDVAVAINLPPERSYNNAWFRRADQPLADGATPPWISYRVVLPGYFEALELPLEGRRLEARPPEGAPLGVVLNRAAADRFFPDVSAVGQRVILGPDGSFPPAEVVGLVDDGQNLSLRGGGPMVYITYESLPFWDDLAFGLRSSVDPATLARQAQLALRALDPRVAVYGAATFDELHRDQFALTRAISRLLGAFATLGLVMATVGLFGVLSYSVTRRRREMGIRLALGADARELRRMVVGRGLVRVVAGLALGVGAAILLTRFLEGLIFGVEPFDPWTYLGVTAVLLVTAAAACWWPALRASGVAPAEVLKEE